MIRHGERLAGTEETPIPVTRRWRSDRRAKFDGSDLRRWRNFRFVVRVVALAWLLEEVEHSEAADDDGREHCRSDEDRFGHLIQRWLGTGRLLGSANSRVQERI